MPDINVFLKKEFEKTGGAKIEKVPKGKRPTVESIETLESEISGQISRNDAMRERTLDKALGH